MINAFPGLCDADEAPETTATRELKEETGYIVRSKMHVCLT